MRAITGRCCGDKRSLFGMPLCFVVALVLAWAVAGRALAAEALKPDKAVGEEVLANLCIGIDIWDPRELATVRRLGARGEEIIPGIIYLLTNHDSIEGYDGATVSGYVLTLLTEFMTCDISPALPYVRALLESKDADVRWTAIRGLRRMGTHEDVVLLLGMLNDEDEGVRKTAEKALPELVSADKVARLKAAVAEYESKGGWSIWDTITASTWALMAASLLTGILVGVVTVLGIERIRKRAG